MFPEFVNETPIIPENGFRFSPRTCYRRVFS